MSYIRNKLEDRGLSKSELLDVSYEIEEFIGQRELLDNIQMALDIDTLRDVLKDIARNFDL